MNEHYTLDSQFESIARAYPNQVAVVEGNNQISYSELSERSGKVAKWIKEYFSDENEEHIPIAIYLPNSIDFVCAKLAILKSNRPYLPLDPKYPEERIRSILALSGTQLIITNTMMQDSFPDGDWDTLCIDKLEQFQHLDSSNHLKPNSPNDTAYIIFTSGSTGTPKGATIRHENVMNVVYWTHDCFSMAGLEVGAQLTRVVFDASVWEYWANLLIGNTVVIIPERIMLDQDELRRLVLSHKIAYLFLPTPLGELFIKEELLPGSSLKWAWVGGDRLLQRPIPSFAAQVANIYGPTECTIVSVYDIVEPIESEEPPPIGYPVANCQIFILDETLNEVPQGDKGEICICGAGVGSGYYNAPELTSEVFIHNPFSEDSRSIMYRSGDLGRYNLEGKLECLGRIDFQVKIRGYRIELGEIEAVLNIHQRVKDVIVLAEGDSNEKVLNAVYTTVDNLEIDDSELVLVCTSKLPDYMIPKNYHFRREFPLTANGKIDRKALARSIQSTTENSEGCLPETEFELSVSDVWSQILGVKSIRLTDRFYELGGHSIKAVQLIGMIRSKLAIDAKVGNLLSNPSLAEFCIYLDKIKPNQNIKINANPPQEYYPISLGQESMWYYWQLDPKRLDYTVIIRFDLDFVPDPELLKQAMLYLQDRHEIMRMGLTLIDGVPYQFFRKEQELLFESYVLYPDDHSVVFENDLCNFGCAEHYGVYPYPFVCKELIDLEDKIRHQGFDSESDPLYRTYLLNFNNENAVLIMNIHHIITDGWSIGLWQKELRTVYFAMEKAISPKLPQLPINYGDYVLWESTSNPKELYPDQLSFWLNTLDPIPEPVNFPVNATIKKEHKYKGKRVWWKLGRKLSNALREFTSDSGLSLFATMLGLLKVQLHIYSGSTDVTLMSVYAGRGQNETRNILGLLTNLFFIRSSIDPNALLTEQIRSENETVIKAMQNLDYPFELLLKELFPLHDKHSDAISKIVFIMQNFPFEHSSDRELILSMRDIGSHSPKFDFLFTVEEDKDDLLCWIEYRPELYSDQLVQQIAEQYTKLCDLLVSKQSHQINELDILTTREKKKLFEEFSGIQMDIPANSYIELWNEAWQKHKSKIAVVSEDKEYSYKDLESRSNRIASLLQQHGIGTGSIVGICMKRGFWLASTLLGTLKTGAAYMPLDVKYPDDRLNHIISDSKTELVTVDEEGYARLNTIDSIKQIRVLNIDALAASIIKLSDSPIDNKILSNNPAYVIYTSGSTGKPKGVLLSHGNLLNHNLAVIKAFNLRHFDRVLQFGSISFDLSVEEIFPTWLAGATLVFRSDTIMDSPEAFLEFIDQKAISVIDIPTAFWHHLVDELEYTTLCPTLRLCVIGGEKAQWHKLQSWLKNTNQHVQLLNTYGPTETTIISTLHEACVSDDGFPIGKPIANTSIYLLNKSLSPVPLGSVGEVFIGGKGVGLGYLNQDDLTNTKFLDNPYSPDGKLYRTGDLAYYTDQGVLHYVGRIDAQVKLMGYRIELEEIANSIREIIDVSDAVVLLADDDLLRPFLCAYVVSHSRSISEDMIRMNLKNKLPEYMIPACFMFIDAIPLTTNGKIDVKSLPSPHRKQEANQVQNKVFYTPEQEVLCKAISDILGLDTVSIHDNFFSLGGNSILSMKLIKKLRNAGLKLNIEQLFKSSNIEELASSLTLQSTDSGTFGDQCLIELRRGKSHKPPLILIHSLPGDVLGYVHLVAKLPEDQPIYGIQALGLVNPDQVHNSISEMAKYYLDVIDRHELGDSFCLGGWCFGGRVAVEMALIYRQTHKNMPLVLLFEAFAYNPISSLKLKYSLHRFKRVVQNWELIPYLLINRLRSKGKYKTNFTKEEVFQDLGIFKNRGMVRTENVNAMYGCKMVTYPGRLVLFRATKQSHGAMQDHTLGWDVFAKKLEIHLIDATHENILKEPQVEKIAQIIASYLLDKHHG